MFKLCLYGSFHSHFLARQSAGKKPGPVWCHVTTLTLIEWNCWSCCAWRPMVCVYVWMRVEIDFLSLVLGFSEVQLLFENLVDGYHSDILDTTTSTTWSTLENTNTQYSVFTPEWTTDGDAFWNVLNFTHFSDIRFQGVYHWPISKCSLPFWREMGPQRLQHRMRFWHQRHMKCTCSLTLVCEKQEWRDCRFLLILIWPQCTSIINSLRLRFNQVCAKKGGRG